MARDDSDAVTHRSGNPLGRWFADRRVGTKILTAVGAVVVAAVASGVTAVIALANVDADTAGAVSSAATQLEASSSDIAAAVEEQTATTDEISRNITQAAAGTDQIAANIAGVAEASQTTSAGITESQAATAELAQAAGTLQHLVGQFRY